MSWEFGLVLAVACVGWGIGFVMKRSVFPKVGMRVEFAIKILAGGGLVLLILTEPDAGSVPAIVFVAVLFFWGLTASLQDLKIRKLQARTD